MNCRRKPETQAIQDFIDALRNALGKPGLYKDYKNSDEYEATRLVGKIYTIGLYDADGNRMVRPRA